MLGDAFARYVDEIRRGSDDLYAAYLVGAMPYSIGDTLSTSDVERILPVLARGLPSDTRKLVQARLAFYAVPPRKRPATKQLKAVRRLLSGVPAHVRDAEWFRMMADTQLRLGDWAGYKRGFEQLYRASACSWGTGVLRDALAAAAKHRDWRTYDRWRPRWDQQQPSATYCECSKHAVATRDGKRAIAARRWNDVPAHLARSGAVDGCPHLNSGGLDLSLVTTLIARRKYLAECRAYLERARAFGNRAAIDRLAKRAGAVSRQS